MVVFPMSFARENVKKDSDAKLMKHKDDIEARNNYFYLFTLDTSEVMGEETKSILLKSKFTKIKKKIITAFICYVTNVCNT